MSDLFEQTYNPDVLSCLANLSNDEVFTPPDLANQVLDMLPKELWHNPDATFLDPCCKSGVFLREIAKRLIDGLEDEIPELPERLDHIFKKQIFGIATTELCSLLSRRSLYCSKYPNCKYSVVQFDKADGNVRYKRCEHTWFNGKCVYCGASQGQLDRGDQHESYAYESIHCDNLEELFPMKFDVIIGNPPYQLSDGGNAASAMPIYQKFVEQSKKLNPRYLSMIIPARWYVGGRGLDSFRHEMLNDRRITILHDYPDAGDCFPGVEIKGGVCFFLWTRDHMGDCEVHSHNNGREVVDRRPLLEPGMDTFLRNTMQVDILKKIYEKSSEYLVNQINAGRFFGFHTRVIWDRSGKRGELQTADGSSSYPVSSTMDECFNTKVYVAHGECWISNSDVARNADKVKSYKVLVPRSGNPGSTILGKMKLSEPGTCSSNTYNVIVCNSKTEAENLLGYLKTKFVRYLIALRTSTQDTAPKAFSFVPIQDFTKKWSDEDLDKQYGLSVDEISAIDSSITAME